MKKLIQFTIIFLWAVSLFAQTPEKFSYQSVIRNANEELLTNTQIGIRISILQGSDTGSAVYIEDHTIMTNANGLVSFEIGGGSGFDEIDWANGPYFMKTEVDPAGGSNYTITGVSQLLFVPFALHAKTAETTTEPLIETDPLWTASPSFGITGANISNWNTAFGWGDHSMAGYMTSFDETDPLWTASPSFGITGTNIINWNTAFGWGDHSMAGYITSFDETDPLWTASPSFGITGLNISNWNTAFGWGDHATAGYTPTTRTLTINGTGYDLAADRNWNVGTVTSIATGDGLTGGPVTSSGTISIPNNGINSAMLQNNSVTSAKIVNGTITAYDIGSSQVVKSINAIKDDVNLVAGSNITITPGGQNLTISAAGSTGIGGSGTTNYLPLFVGNTTLGNSVVYQSSGNIGIGMTTPSVPLHVYGTGQVGIQFNGNNDYYASIYVNAINPDAVSGFGFLKNGVLRGKIDVDNDYSLRFRTGPTLISRMIVDYNGNVGIGTASPLYPLHVSTNRKYAGYFSTDSVYYDACAVHGEYLGTGTIDAKGVYGKSTPANNFGYGGYFEGGYIGVRGYANSLGSGSYYGVRGSANSGTGTNYGVYGVGSYGTTNYGVYGYATGGTYNYAGSFSGDVNVSGLLSKGGGSFKIDHPLDPANKYLYHSFVESPDMMNMYNGNVITDGSGFAMITLPEWFEALNKDFRYQLTVIGDFAQAIITREVQGNRFEIRTDKPNIKVSWQVTGIRKDAFAEKNRIPVEEYKKGDEAGKYIHPEAFGLPESMGIDYDRNREGLEREKSTHSDQ
jgi:hypothetical protein